MRLFGPHFYYDIVRLARRGQSTRLRVIYLLALFAVLIYMYETMITSQIMRPNELGHVTERFAYVLFLVQNIAVLVLAPAYFASAIAEERERRTLELLFTTQLSSTEIILGILGARILHLAGFVLAGFPILCALQFWGGVDMLLLAGNLVNTLLNIVTIGSVCLLISVLAQTASGALLASYLILLPVGMCFMGTTAGGLFVLQDERSASTGFFTVQHLPWIFLGHALTTATVLWLAASSLRKTGVFEPSMLPACSVESVSAAGPAQIDLPRMVRERERLDPVGNAYTLPPVSDNSLLWKERFLGGPALAFSPTFLALAVPILVLVLLFLVTSVVRTITHDQQDFAHRFDAWCMLLRAFYYLFLSFYILSVAFRTTASVARERQQQTLEPLLLLPIDRREILFAKGLGSLCHGWPWLALLFGDVVLGVCIGAYHPFSAVLLCMGPWPIIFFFASLGLLLSVTVKTVLRANLVMVLVLIVFLCSTITSIADQRSLVYLETFAFSYWIPGEPTPENLIAALILMAVYLFGAAICWRLARVLFDRRAHHPGEAAGTLLE